MRVDYGGQELQKRLLRIAAIFVAFALLAVPTGAGAQPALLSLSPAATAAPVGSEVLVELVVSGASDLYGCQVSIAFDAARLQVRDADGNPGNGVQVSAGELFQTAYQAVNLADNGAGTISFAASLQRPAPPVNGSGSLVRIVFTAVGSGAATISIAAAVLADSDGYVLEHTVGPAVTIAVGDVGFISGRVLLQGRTAHAGTLVYAGPYSALTDDTGAFRIALPPGAHEVRTRAPRYLDALRVGVSVQIGQETALAAAKLLGGDANDDGMVNIIDLSIIGAAFGSSTGSARWDERADINGDGFVNICDMTLATSNFGRVEPLPWP